MLLLWDKSMSPAVMQRDACPREAGTAQPAEQPPKERLTVQNTNEVKADKRTAETQSDQPKRGFPCSICTGTTAAIQA
jgi:hypothetical protein